MIESVDNKQREKADDIKRGVMVRLIQAIKSVQNHEPQRRLPHGKYLLHWFGCPQKNDHILY